LLIFYFITIVLVNSIFLVLIPVFLSSWNCYVRRRSIEKSKWHAMSVAPETGSFPVRRPTVLPRKCCSSSMILNSWRLTS
jgi:hypothetical protein